MLGWIFSRCSLERKYKSSTNTVRYEKIRMTDFKEHNDGPERSDEGLLAIALNGGIDARFLQ